MRKRTTFLKDIDEAIDGDITVKARASDVDYKIIEDDGLEDNPAVSPLMGMSQDQVDSFCLSCSNITREPAFNTMLTFYSNFLANRAIKYATPQSIVRIQAMACLIEMLKDEFKTFANVHHSKVVSREVEEDEQSDEVN